MGSGYGGGALSYDLGWGEMLSTAYYVRSYLVFLTIFDRTWCVTSSANYINSVFMDLNLTPRGRALVTMLGPTGFEEVTALHPERDHAGIGILHHLSGPRPDVCGGTVDRFATFRCNAHMHPFGDGCLNGLNDIVSILPFPAEDEIGHEPHDETHIPLTDQCITGNISGIMAESVECSDEVVVTNVVEHDDGCVRDLALVLHSPNLVHASDDRKQKWPSDCQQRAIPPGVLWGCNISFQNHTITP